VVLAAGRGQRFGGLKQLAAMRADRATVTDVLLERAAEAGVERAVIVVRAEIEPQLRAHLDAIGWPEIPTVFAVQRQPRGTADAVVAARDALDGSAIVVNADDLYPASAFRTLVAHLRDASNEEHATIAFRLDRTLLGARPESRALLLVDDDGVLVGVREGRIEKTRGLRFVRDDRSEPVPADALVSMNMWGFRPSGLAAIETAVSTNDGAAGEIYLPDVVAQMVAAGAPVRALPSDEVCIGLTYADDVDALRSALS
jgi:bifunctional N-acetylglucosamine-1-phosphate-uridyltransferase/glucosamine-1-phosphate-acetyltransferase GlmU-like protein